MIVAAHNAADSGALISRAHASVVSAPTVSGCSGGVDGDMAAHRSVCLVGAASRLARSFQAGRLARLAGSPKLPYLMRAPRSRALWPRSTLSSSASALLCSAALSPTCTCHSSHRDNHLSFTLSSLPPSLPPSSLHLPLPLAALRPSSFFHPSTSSLSTRIPHLRHHVPRKHVVLESRRIASAASRLEQRPAHDPLVRIAARTTAVPPEPPLDCVLAARGIAVVLANCI